MEKVKTTSIKNYLYLLGGLVVLLSVIFTLIVQTIIGYFEFSSFYQSRFTDFWNQPHYFILFASYFSGAFIPICTVILLANIFFKKVIKQELRKMNFILENLTRDNLHYKTPTSKITEFNLILDTSNKIKEELSKKLIQQWTSENNFQNSINIMKHELNTPITIAQGHLELIKIYSKNQENDQINNEVLIVQKSIERFKNHVDETLGLIKLTNIQNLQNESWSLNSLFDYITEFYSIVFLQQGKHLVLSPKLDTKLDVSIYGDYFAIQHIIDNLLSNALKFSKTEATIEYSQTTENISFFLKNDGPPFTEKELKHAFDENFKGNHSQGNGIGLHFTKHLVAVNKASISIKNIDEKPCTILTLRRI